MKEKRKKGLLRRFLPYFKKYKWILVFDLFCASLTTVCELVLPLIVRFITDRASNAPHTLTVRIIFYVGAFYLVLKLKAICGVICLPIFPICLFPTMMMQK